MSTEVLFTSVQSIKAELKQTYSSRWLHLEVKLLDGMIALDIFPSDEAFTLSNLAQVSQTINRELSK